MKSQYFTAGALAVAGLLATAMTSQAAQFKLNSNGLTLQLNPNAKIVRHLSCKVWGTPVEFPSFVLLTNDGNVSIAKGTRIHWQTRDGARSGNFTIPNTLAVGRSVYAPEPGGYARGAPCDVAFTTGPLQRQPRPNVTVNLGQPINKLPPYRVKCFAAGPVEFPDRVVIQNEDSRTIPAGTHVHWTFNPKLQGTFILSAPMAQGHSVATNLYPSPGGNATCTASITK